MNCAPIRHTPPPIRSTLAIVWRAVKSADGCHLLHSAGPIRGEPIGHGDAGPARPAPRAQARPGRSIRAGATAGSPTAAPGRLPDFCYLRAPRRDWSLPVLLVCSARFDPPPWRYQRYCASTLLTTRSRGRGRLALELQRCSFAAPDIWAWRTDIRAGSPPGRIGWRRRLPSRRSSRSSGSNASRPTSHHIRLGWTIVNRRMSQASLP